MLLRFNISDGNASRVFEALERNKSLKRLNLSCDMGMKACISLSNALARNSTMEKIKLEIDDLESEEGCIRVSEGLENNTRLNYFKLSGHMKDVNKVQEVFANMLLKNFSLETLLVFNAWNPHMEFYLKLNQTGKRLLLRDSTASRENWIDALISTRNDLDCLFYFMSMNPILCMAVNNSG
jgi:hypothetical protein